SHAGMDYRQRERSLLDQLRDDPELLTSEIWRIFELDPLERTLLPPGEVDNRWSWAHALSELSREGRLDRERLLTAPLEALRRGLHPKNTGWFHKFHEHLQPTLAERGKRQALYMDLLGHSVPAVAGFALAALAELA